MHCPRCGQQQVSEETRFCSRCGFPLSLVSEILANGGVLPQLAELQRGGENKKWLTRKNALKFSLAWFLLITFLLTPLAAIADAEEAAASFAVIGFMGGLLMMALSFLFLPKEIRVWQPPGNTSEQANYFAPQTNQNALPPPQSQPVHDYVPAAGSWKAPDTGEFARPGSVTEGTTKLLQKDE